MTYVRAGSVGETVALLAEHGPDARILAGGQSLIPIMSAGLARPSLLVDVMRMDGAAQLVLENGHVRIGFGVRHLALERAEPSIAGAAPLLPAAAPFIGSRAVRNRGTLVGSVAHADPAGEWPAVAVALDASIPMDAYRRLAWRSSATGTLRGAVRNWSRPWSGRVPTSSKEKPA